MTPHHAHDKVTPMEPQPTLWEAQYEEATDDFCEAHARLCASLDEDNSSVTLILIDMLRASVHIDRLVAESHTPADR